MKTFTFFLRAFLVSLAVLLVSVGSAQTLATMRQKQPKTGQSGAVKLKSILQELKAHYGVDLLYADRLVKNIVVAAPAINWSHSLENNLTNLLSPFGLEFSRQKGGSYVISPVPKQPSVNPAPRSSPDKNAVSTETATTPISNESGEKTAALPVAPKITENEISGKVTAENGEVLPGVSIVVKGTSRGTTTGADGKFRLIVPDGGAVLVFSYVGYEPQDIPVTNQSQLTVSMKADFKALNEVVVVGYGTVKKRDLTGSVASIGSSEIRAQPISGMNQALQGRVSGVQVTQASNSAGGGVQIRIRGGNSISASNDPLYVIDGFPVTNPTPASGASNSNAFPNVLATLNPNDIESMEVLKDASATAIYGSRGANGVVLITTRRGKEGQSSIEFETYYSVSRITKLHEMINASESLKLKNEQLVNLGRPERFGTDPAYGTKKPDEYLPGTDWQRAIYHDAPTQNYQLTFSGGNDKLRYLISGNYFNQDGIIITNNFKRYSARLNLDAKLSERIKVGTNFTMTRSDNRMVTESSSASPVQTALQKTPAQTVFNADGTYTLDFLGMQAIPNPIALLRTSTNTLQSDRMLGTLFGEIKLADGLTGRVSVGADIINSRRNVFFTPQTLIANATNGYGSVGNAVNTNILNENTLSYSRTIGNDHGIDLLAGITFQKNKEVRAYSEAQDFPNYSLGAGNLGLGNKLLAPSGSTAEWGLASYIGRVNYRLKDRYLFTATGRIDGSSRFGANNKYGFFPSGAFAWRVSDEAFLRNNKVISDLKFRLSYGITGNDGIGLYNSLSQYGTGRMVLNDQEQLYIEASRIANPDLRWEKTAQFDAGVDVGLLNNRIQLTADYYVKTTSDLLLGVELPSTTGFTNVLRNIGSVENRGFELGINTTNLNRGGFKWTTSGNVSFNQNKVLKLADATQFFVGSESEVIVKVGQPLGSFYGTVFDGIWQTAEEIKAAGNRAITGALPGAPKFKDVNGDGLYNQATDRTILGNGLPKFIFGLTNNLSFKGFDLSIFFQGVQGNKIFNSTFRQIVGGDPGGNKLREYAEGAWRANSPSNTYYAIRQWDLGVNSFYVEDGSFLRLKNVSLSYQLPLKTRYIKRVRVYVSGQNLLTFTRYKGYDPEVNSDFNSNTLYGFDRFAYPASRTFTLGGNFTF
ncbi:SusC/RagA family TonB-linked outer membrane protein [Larkinella rosea]|uniref:TonB-dependent receptor n=1 Tax=Larkinella rosea TaxID=2025312 RepID=A0A3P1BRL4_9BACT|nr:TonB-dependent receptor [Larkinella rosea]RRB03688.1 TonB-dependent receptor [Larkinella rosea]